MLLACCRFPTPVSLQADEADMAAPFGCLGVFFLSIELQLLNEIKINEYLFICIWRARVRVVSGSSLDAEWVKRDGVGGFSGRVAWLL